MNVRDLDVSIHSNFDLASLEADWTSLQEKADHRFFLSWGWIESWLTTFPIEPSLLKVRYQSNVVGLVLFCKKSVRRHTLFSVEQCFINESGVPDFDQQWIEYNKFLIDDKFKNEVYKVIVNALITQVSWDELRFGVTRGQDAIYLQNALNLNMQVDWSSESHGIDLNSLRDNQSDYLSSLSRNTRSQIRRSIKEYEKHGPLSIEHATSKRQSSEFLAEIAPLHKERWGVGYQESGFANHYFCDFHQKLLDNNWEQGYIDAIRVKCGDEPIAYFYNYIYGNRVYFYISALVFESNNKKKPGMVGHALCIQQYLDNGLSYYDFMGGGEKYKDSLATRTGKFLRVTYQKPRLKLKIENKLRSIKHRLARS